MTSANGRCESVPTPVASAAGSNPKRRHQCRHHDRTQPQDRAFRIASVDADAVAAEFVDIGDVDDGRLHRDAEQSARKPMPDEAENGVSVIHSATMPPDRRRQQARPAQ